MALTVPAIEVATHSLSLPLVTTRDSLCTRVAKRRAAEPPAASPQRSKEIGSASPLMRPGRGVRPLHRPPARAGRPLRPTRSNQRHTQPEIRHHPSAASPGSQIVAITPPFSPPVGWRRETPRTPSPGRPGKPPQSAADGSRLGPQGRERQSCPGPSLRPWRGRARLGCSISKSRSNSARL